MVGGGANFRPPLRALRVKSTVPCKKTGFFGSLWSEMGVLWVQIRYIKSVVTFLHLFVCRMSSMNCVSCIDQKFAATFVVLWCGPSENVKKFLCPVDQKWCVIATLLQKLLLELKIDVQGTWCALTCVTLWHLSESISINWYQSASINDNVPMWLS